MNGEEEIKSMRDWWISIMADWLKIVVQKTSSPVENNKDCHDAGFCWKTGRFFIISMLLGELRQRKREGTTRVHLSSGQVGRDE